jgi:hypothetical protein
MVCRYSARSSAGDTAHTLAIGDRIVRVKDIDATAFRALRHGTAAIAFDASTMKAARLLGQRRTTVACRYFRKPP